MFDKLIKTVALFLGVGGAVSVSALDFNGQLGVEQRIFFQEAPFDQSQNQASFFIEPNWVKSWQDDKYILSFKPFLRWDLIDDRRTHVDIRELIWTGAWSDWELKLGIGKVFWGVAESRHLVDIINQTDLIENIDEEDKFGQAMINLAWITEYGTFDAFILPYFKERSFPGASGRLRGPFVVDVGRPLYESSAKQHHMDLALRWSHVIDDWDLGLSVFHGTARDPEWVPDPLYLGSLRPKYSIISQWGLDLQGTFGDWLLKFEGIHRHGQSHRFWAFVGGFEYTQVGIFETEFDLGWILEYHFDDRRRNSPQPFNHDLALGFRLALNDAQSTELLCLALLDGYSNGKMIRIEASRRVFESFKLSIEGTWLTQINASDPLFAWARDDFIQAELSYFW